MSLREFELVYQFPYVTLTVCVVSMPPNAVKWSNKLFDRKIYLIFMSTKLENLVIHWACYTLYSFFFPTPGTSKANGGCSVKTICSLQSILCVYNIWYIMLFLSLTLSLCLSPSLFFCLYFCACIMYIFSLLIFVLFIFSLALSFSRYSFFPRKHSFYLWIWFNRGCIFWTICPCLG